MIIASRISHGSNVVVVNSQSVNRKFFSLSCNWMLTTTFFPWDILEAMVIRNDISGNNVQEGLSKKKAAM